MVLNIAATAVGAVLVIGGLAGCIVPVLPGPPVTFAALLILSLAGGWTLYPVWLLILLALLAVAAAVFDSILPAAASRRAGAGKVGVWGSVVGMVIGTFLFPPFGTFIGAFLGALAGEILTFRENSRPLKAALGVFTGTMAATVVKLAVSGTIAVFFVRGAVALLA
jgi:uncharacterized protein YqgC (DUF456 family)